MKKKQKKKTKKCQKDQMHFCFDKVGCRYAYILTLGYMQKHTGT